MSTARAALPPTLFLSHGAPTLVVSDHPAARWMKRLGAALPRPAAIVVVSAHWQTAPLALTGGHALRTIHDFHGFPEALYRIEYPARGDPGLAERVAACCAAQGVAVAVDPNRGLDHGAWVPLGLMYPEADIPVCQVALPATDLDDCTALGIALAPLRAAGVLIIGSGSSTHNLRAMNVEGVTAPWAQGFEAWLADAVERRGYAHVSTPDLLPADFPRAHPTSEHFLPLLVAWAAAGTEDAGRRIHHSFDYGNLGMSCFGWGALPEGI